MDHERKAAPNLSWSEFLAVLTGLTFSAVVLIAALGNLWPGQRGSCQHNLKHFAMAMHLYAQESKGEFYPPVAPYASFGLDGGLTPSFAIQDFDTLYPEYLADIALSGCPTDLDATRSWWKSPLRQVTKAGTSALPGATANPVRDSESETYYRTAEFARSYVYLGHAVKVVPEFHGWLGAMALLPVTGSVQVEGVGEVAIKNFSGDLSVEQADWPSWVPFPDHEAGMKALDSPYEVTTLPKVYRLREGIERYFIMDINGPNAPAYLPSALPVMWDAYGSRTLGGPVDRFNHEPAGSNVLFLDGHVQFIRYPDKFPVVADRHMTDYFGRQGQG